MNTDAICVYCRRMPCDTLYTTCGAEACHKCTCLTHAFPYEARAHAACIHASLDTHRQVQFIRDAMSASIFIGIYAPLHVGISIRKYIQQARHRARAWDQSSLSCVQGLTCKRSCRCLHTYAAACMSNRPDECIIASHQPRHCIYMSLQLFA